MSTAASLALVLLLICTVLVTAFCVIVYCVRRRDRLKEMEKLKERSTPLLTAYASFSDLVISYSLNCIRAAKCSRAMAPIRSLRRHQLFKFKYLRKDRLKSTLTHQKAGGSGCRPYSMQAMITRSWPYGGRLKLLARVVCCK